MYAPGVMNRVASLYDNRMFDEFPDPSIEFHIHAFLSPNTNNQQSLQTGGQ